MPKYKAVLFAPDGDWVTDFRGCDTKKEVIEQLANRGSRCFFYPYDGVIIDKLSAITTAKQRIVDMPPPFSFLIGKSIGTASKYIKASTEELEVY